MAESDAANAGERPRDKVPSGIHPFQGATSSDSTVPDETRESDAHGSRAETGAAGASMPAAAARDLPLGYLAAELDDADRLLSYASEVGIEVEEETRSSILRARASSGAPMTQAIGGNLLAALAKLAAQVSPVTAQSLRAGADPAQPRTVLRAYTGIAAGLAFICVTFSGATFVSSAIADSIRKDVETANGLALNLGEEARLLAPAPDGAGGGSQAAAPAASISPKDMLRELQQFAVTIRAIKEHTRQVRWFSVGFAAPERALTGVAKEERIELRVPLNSLSEERDEAIAKIRLYQDVRYNAVYETPFSAA